MMEINVFSSSLTTKYPKWHSNLMNVLFTCMHIYTHAEAFSSNLKLNRKQLLFSRCPLESCTHILYVLYAAQKRKKKSHFSLSCNPTIAKRLKDWQIKERIVIISVLCACVCVHKDYVSLTSKYHIFLNQCCSLSS